jgi:hypothetical protein
LLLALALLWGCEESVTQVALDNRYPPSADRPLVIYRAVWQAVSFDDPVVPGASSLAMDTVPASANTAYILLAPGYRPPAPPGNLIVLRSRTGFAVSTDRTLRIPVDDSHFAGHCQAGSVLSREQADFITTRVFADEFAGQRYDPATCTTTAAP